MNRLNRQSCLQALSAGIIFILTLILLGLSGDVVAAPLEAAANSETSVSLTWSAPGDDGNVGTASAYSIRYATATITDGTWGQATVASSPPAPQVAGSTEAFDVTGLTPGTQYYFAIKAADEVGNWSALSNIVSATTDPESVPPAIVADLSLIDSSATTLTLSWTAPGDDDNVGTATTYDLRYSTSIINDANFGSATAVANVGDPRVAGSSETIIISGLSPSSSYYFALKSSDEVPNTSPLSNILNGSTTAEIFAPTAISDLVALNATETTIDLAWTATGDDSTSGQATQYSVRYSTSPISEVNWAAATEIAGVSAPLSSGNAEVYTVSSLASNTQYYFAIKVVDDVGNWSSLSNVATLSTGNDQTPPSAIGDLSVTSGQ